jgi:Flp pilus assembly protein protease CpaA
MLIPLVLAAALVVCSVTDIRDRRIPNAVTFPLAAVALVANAAGSFETALAEPLGAIGLPASLAGLAACFALMLANHLFAGHGAGDVKLAAGIGGCVGFEAGLITLAYTYMIAGLVAAGMLVARRRQRVEVETAGDRGVPLAPCLAIGCGLAVAGLTGWEPSLSALAWSPR